MKIIDSNLIIYSAQSDYNYLRPLVEDNSNFISAISKVEVLGYHQLKPAHISYFENIFHVLQMIPLETPILDKAIELRQKYRLKLGDSLIAASALLFNLELQTRNISDFTKIPDLKLFNPIP
jgi:predicted nucleic acid-binding protein